MNEHDRQNLRDAGDTGRDEVPTGPARQDDEFPQPVQEIVDPNEPDPLADRERTSIAGYRTPHEEA